MKNVLIVAESEESTKCMLEKSLRFSPEAIRVVYFEGSASSAASIQTAVKNAALDHCDAETIIKFGNTLQAKSEALAQMVNETKPDMVVIHRPQLGKEVQDYSLIKAVLQSSSRSAVLLCGNNLWKPKIKLVATLDIIDESSVQKSLNAQVLDVSIEISQSMQAELAFLSVIAVSKISEELDVVDSNEILAKKGKSAKAKLEKVIQEKSASLTYSTHVSVGVPANEIPSVSQKLKSSLVVLGNVGRTGIKGLFVGNTAEKILNRLAVDALIVKQ